MASDREALARLLAELEPDEDWPTNAALGGSMTGTRDDEYYNAMLEQADAILASDWLAQHDAEVREATKAGIAEAIEESCPPLNQKDHTALSYYNCTRMDASIARTWEPTP